LLGVSTQRNDKQQLAGWTYERPMQIKQTDLSS